MNEKDIFILPIRRQERNLFYYVLQDKHNIYEYNLKKGYFINVQYQFKKNYLQAVCEVTFKLDINYLQTK